MITFTQNIWNWVVCRTRLAAWRSNSSYHSKLYNTQIPKNTHNTMITSEYFSLWPKNQIVCRSDVWRLQIVDSEVIAIFSRCNSKFTHTTLYFASEHMRDQTKKWTHNDWNSKKSINSVNSGHHPNYSFDDTYEAVLFILYVIKSVQILEPNFIHYFGRIRFYCSE